MEKCSECDVRTYMIYEVIFMATGLNEGICMWILLHPVGRFIVPGCSLMYSLCFI